MGTHTTIITQRNAPNHSVQPHPKKITIAALVVEKCQSESEKAHVSFILVYKL